MTEKFSHRDFKVFLALYGLLPWFLFFWGGGGWGEHWENAFGDLVRVLIAKEKMDV